MADATGSEHEARRAPVQEPFLNSLCRQGTRVSIYLLNGVHLQGTIESFDQFSVMIRNTATKVVYKHAISTVVSAGYRSVAMTREAATTADPFSTSSRVTVPPFGDPRHTDRNP